MKFNYRFYVKTIAALVLVGLLTTSVSAADKNLPIRVNSPKKLGTWKIPAERIAMGPGYKPSMARLSNGELVMVALRLNDPKTPTHERTDLWRSSDNGKTWSDRVLVETGPGKDLIGREQWLTCIDDGTPTGILLTTNHILKVDVQNPKPGVALCSIARSTDGGKSWTQTFLPPKWTHTSRNVVQMPDGKLMLGVSKNGLPADKAAWWISTDKGANWTESPKVTPPGYTDGQGAHAAHNNFDGFFTEDFTYRNDSGTLLHWIRCGPPSPMYPMGDGRAVPSGDDGIDRTMFCKSTDGGKTWSDLKDFGDYGRHYPRVLKLADGRLLMTYTQRATIYPLGLRAQFSYDDGQTWDFEHDQIVIEGKTPWNGHQGGGFGNTVQLSDGSLISCYSYQDGPGYWSYKAGDWAARLKVEVVRWRLPEVK